VKCWEKSTLLKQESLKTDYDYLRDSWFEDPASIHLGKSVGPPPAVVSYGPRRWEKTARFCPIWREVRKVKKLDSNQMGLATGGFVAGIHFLWSLLVALGVAQVLLDWIFSLHFVNNPYRVHPFDLVTCVTLLIVTFIVGYLLGWISTWLWNLTVKEK